MQVDETNPDNRLIETFPALKKLADLNLEEQVLFSSYEHVGARIRRDVSFLQKVISQFKVCTPDYISDRYSNLITGHSQTFFELYEQLIIRMNELKHQPNNLDTIINQYNNMSTFYNELTELMLKIIGFFNTTDQYRYRLDQYLSSAEKNSKSIQAILQKSEDRLLDAETRLKEVVVSSQSKSFEKEADDNSKLARNWLISGVSVLGLLILIMIANLFHVSVNSSSGDFIESILAYFQNFDSFVRISIFSLLTYAMVFCFKNYRANRHSETHNKFKKNALNTFQAFTDASDEETKKQILLQACAAIYSIPSTGFDKHESHDDHPAGMAALFSLLTKK